MADQQGERRGSVPLKAFLADWKAHMSDHDLREKYKLSAQAFIKLIKALIAKGVITPKDLARRKEMTVQRDLAREAEFIAGLFMCPHCGHPSPQRFEECPACGYVMSEAATRTENLIDSLTTQGGRFHVEEEVEEIEVETDEEEMDQEAGRTKDETPFYRRPIGSFFVSDKDKAESDPDEKPFYRKPIGSLFGNKEDKKKR